MRLAEFTHLHFDRITNFACFRQLLVPRAFKFRGVRETPVEACRHTWKDRAAFGRRLIADRDDKREQLTGFEQIEDAARFLQADVDAVLAQDFNCQWIQYTGFDAGALSEKM